MSLFILQIVQKFRETTGNVLGTKKKESTLGKKDTNSITVFETNKGLKKSRRNNNKGERETRDGDR